ncbi:hypothetical protein EZH22_30575 (plasmid) [Xanthobacter dioxanivorans]|uniref:Uncharacterized protein n=1 Tax=Xanthobacter dioxanivorans TaxID=2528964 RepID=A0A974SLM6_9HYPH|nr:hypothetical protein [Xanthobacter dioxanivorans]QRG10075.1 hypothetical protein EZH22_30575 [Xanthobacter dioxanivorans]
MIYARNEFNNGVAALAGFLAGSIVGGSLMMTAILFARTNDLVGPESPRWMIALLVPALASALVGGWTWIFYHLFLRLQRRIEHR